jgi:hypothetical protein
MPSKSPAQARLMAGVAHNPDFAKKVGIAQSVGKDFNQADKGTGILSHAAGGPIGSQPMPPTMGTSTAYPPPPGHRKEGPRNYGKGV